MDFVGQCLMDVLANFLLDFGQVLMDLLPMLNGVLANLWMDFFLVYDSGEWGLNMRKNKQPWTLLILCQHSVTKGNVLFNV